jgi:8-oxo-dGTP pyrophosphatase MutT (NUDIX family)
MDPAKGDTDAVAAIAIYRRLLHYDVIVLVRQYRPAINGYTIEFPAGLLESGETSEEAALRELKEETGWHGEVTHMSSRLSVDPTCSSSIVRYATVKINGDSFENQSNPQPNKKEVVDLLMIPISELHDRLTRLNKEGHVIDSRVEAFAIGLKMGLKFAKDAEIDAASNNQSSLPVDGSCVRTGTKRN